MAKTNFDGLYPEQIAALSDDKYTTNTRALYADAFRLRNKVPLDKRPENVDLEAPMSVQLLRLVERASQKLDRIEAKQTGFFQSIANIFKSGAGEMERHYPSKKK